MSKIDANMEVQCPHCDYVFTGIDKVNTGIGSLAKGKVGSYCQCPSCKCDVYVFVLFHTDYQVFKTEEEFNKTIE